VNKQTMPNVWARTRNIFCREGLI